jgi:ankyrin repeat protein
MSMFVTLPNELLLEIARSVDERPDLLALTLVSKQCHGVADPVLWQREVSLNRPGPLHWAIEEENISLVRKALDHGADPNQLAYRRWPRPVTMENRWWDYTPHRSSVQSFTSNGHSHNDRVDNSWAEFGWSCWRPLHLAVTKGRTDMVELLLDHGAAIDSLSWRLCDCVPHPSNDLFPGLNTAAEIQGQGFLDIKDGGWTPLHLAICHQDVEMAKLLLRRGASTDTHRDLRWNHNASSEPSPRGNVTAMHEAARFGFLDLMIFLVEGGYQSVDTYSHLVGKPIHLAIWNMHFDTVVPWLKEQGANLDEVCRETDTTPLLVMCKNHQLDSIVQLIELGADVSSRVENHHGFTALHLLAYPAPDDQGNSGGRQNATKSEVVKLLVSNGLDVDTPERASGFSALIVASAHCNLNMMRTLLECGADPNYRELGGSTAFNKVGVLTESPRPRIYEAGRMLSDWGLDIQGPFAENQTTPLNSVCLARARSSVASPFRDRQFLKLARLLLIRGADPNQTGRFSSGPVSQAIYSCAFGMASLLLENGGRPQVNDLEMLLKPMVLRPTYQSGLVSYVLGLDYQKYGILRPSNMFLDDLIKKSFIQGAWQATAELVEHHRSSALPANALHRALDRPTQEVNTASNLPLPLVRALLKDGADPNATWKGEPALYYAGRAAALEACTKELIAAGADLEITTPKMPQGALLFLFSNGRHCALGHIIEHDDKILHNRPKEFHSKCWEYLLRPGANRDTIEDSQHLAAGEQEGTNTDSSTSEIDLEEEDYDITPIAWQPICEYIKRGLRTDVDLERGRTLRNTIQKVALRCPMSDYDARSQIFEHLGLSAKELGLKDELIEYERWRLRVIGDDELPFH